MITGGQQKALAIAGIAGIAVVGYLLFRKPKEQPQVIETSGIVSHPLFQDIYTPPKPPPPKKDDKKDDKKNTVDSYLIVNERVTRRD